MKYKGPKYRVIWGPYIGSKYWLVQRHERSIIWQTIQGFLTESEAHDFLNEIVREAA